MNDYILYYTTATGAKGSIPFSTGDSYELASDFVAEFEFDHPHYTVDSVEEDNS